MADMWNKYEPTAARKHGKPGRETRPKSITIDMHAHVAIAARAARSRARISISSKSRSTISRRRDQGAQWPSRQPTSATASATPTRGFASWTTWASTCSSSAAGPPQLYYTVPLDIAVKATRMLNDGIAEYVGKHTDRLCRARRRAAAGRQRGRQGARALHEDAQVQGRRNPDQRRRQGTVRSRLRAVLEEGRGARRAGDDPSQRLHRRPTA